MDRSLTRRNSLLFLTLLAFSACLLLASRCSTATGKLPLGAIPFPEDNPLTEEKIALGRKLFFDKRLSDDNSISCADCHRPELAFTDGRARSPGFHDSLSQRNSPTLLNSAYLKTVMFDGELKTLEMQVIVPIQEHSEMHSDMKKLILELRAVPEYEAAAQKIFGRTFDPWVLTRSIAAFERTLISQNSAFDRFYAGDQRALTASQKRGWKLFSEELYCTKCHQPPHFTNYEVRNNGLYSDYGTDQGRYRIDGLESSKGLFKVPTLRNIVLTGPYMHNGIFTSLDDVLDHYRSGGKKHSNQSEIIVAFDLNEQKRSDLLNFFQALTDTSYLRYFQ